MSILSGCDVVPFNMFKPVSPPDYCLGSKLTVYVLCANKPTGMTPADEEHYYAFCLGGLKNMDDVCNKGKEP
ncbi:hypothetical protein [Leptospira venezuelensis]|uniref:hypothetical protein n=1 Tax=Leptospira venezuelensis TaxID=1958811 RepID=UPI0030061568